MLRNFWRKLAFYLINNEFLENEEDKPLKGERKLRLVFHKFLTALPHAKKFCTGKWEKFENFKYQQYTCKQFGCS